MSADNWAVCPRCLSEATGRRAADERRVAALYGRVPVEEFDAKRAALAEVNPESFREDYEIYGAEDGTVEVSYSGGCRECGVAVDFKHAKSFWPTGSD